MLVHSFLKYYRAYDLSPMPKPINASNIDANGIPHGDNGEVYRLKVYYD
jgi:hypothetical protein